MSSKYGQSTGLILGVALGIVFGVAFALCFGAFGSKKKQG